LGNIEEDINFFYNSILWDFLAVVQFSYYGVSAGRAVG